MSDLLAAALAAAERGWRVFPLRRHDKRPAVKDWETRATTDVERIRRCWSAGLYNVGIATGPSGLYVVDLDTPKTPADVPPPQWQLSGVACGADALAVLAEQQGQPFPTETHTVITARGGMHLYFQRPESLKLGNTTSGRNGIGWLIDSRTVGGYVVAPGSVVTIGSDGEVSPNGRPCRYRVGHVDQVAPMPGWISELYRRARTPERTPSPPATDLLAQLRRRSGYVGAALLGEVTRVLKAKPKTRNDTLCRAAFALGQLVAGGLLPEQLATEALQQAGEATGLTPVECAATIRSGLNGGARKPRAGTT